MLTYNESIADYSLTEHSLTYAVRAVNADVTGIIEDRIPNTKEADKKSTKICKEIYIKVLTNFQNGNTL